MKQNQFIIGVLLFIVSCKKDPPPVINNENQRITSMRNKVDGETTTFNYDNENRLTRIDYSNSYDGTPSLRFEYTLPTINARYYKGAAPDMTREKYTFTVLNGMIVNTRMTRPDGFIYDTYYDYDNSNRMIEAGHRVISNTGALIMSLDCYISYSQNNTQEIKLYGVRGLSATDTIIFTRTFDLQRNYFTFDNIGFNYFGSFSTGITYVVSGITHVVIPFPFFISRPSVGEFPMVPSKNAMKLLTGGGKARNMGEPFNNDWYEVTWHRDYPDGEYKYDELGRVAEERNKYLFTWK